MAYEVDKNRTGSNRLRQEMGVMPSGRVYGREGASPHHRFYELEPAQVIEVTLTGTDSRKIGEAVVRPLYSFATVPEKDLPTAIPLDSNIKNYPLKNEVVVVVEYNGTLYYSQRINFFNLVNNNITVDPFSYLSQREENQRDYQETSTGNPNVGNESSDEQRMGNKYFRVNKKVQSLRPMEGDIIYEGRFGQSIRFGGSVDDGVSEIGSQFPWAKHEKNGSPIIIIRAGQKEGGNERLPYIEDINKDPSSIYITNGHLVPFLPSSKNNQSYRNTMPNKWDGNQIILSSDRIILNDRKNGTFIFSPKTIGLSTGGSVNIDAKGLFIVNSPLISLGLNASEPVVKGYVWLKVMIKLLTALQTETHPTPAGTSGFPVNANLYASLQNELTKALSTVTWTE